MTRPSDTSVKLSSLAAPDSEVSFTVGGNDEVGVGAV